MHHTFILVLTVSVKRERQHISLYLTNNALSKDILPISCCINEVLQVCITFQELLVRSKWNKFLRVLHVHWNSWCICRIFESPERHVEPWIWGSHCSRTADIIGDTCHPVSIQHPLRGWILSITASWSALTHTLVSTNDLELWHSGFTNDLELWHSGFCNLVCMVTKKTALCTELASMNIWWWSTWFYLNCSRYAEMTGCLVFLCL